MFAQINEDSIRIIEMKGADEKEIVGWTKDEWVEDPETVVPAIANAIMLCYENPEALLEQLGK